MSRTRHALALLLGLTLLGSLTARANPAVRGNPKDVIEDAATRQGQLKRAFESLRVKLAVLAGRLEASASEKDRDRARAIRRALEHASKQGTEMKFDVLIRALTGKGSERNLDVLNQVLRDNADLRKDLQTILTLLTDDDRDSKLAQRKAELSRLLDQLKELKSKQERLQAQTERGKRDNKELGKDQNKLTGQTRAVIEPDKDEEKGKEDRDKIRKPIEEAVRRQQDAEGKLGKGDASGASDSQGQAADKIGEAIREIENSITEVRREERERQLGNLLARCKKMLKFQEEILDGSEQIDRELRKLPDSKPTVAHAARANKLADRQEESLREADGALKLIESEGSAVAFAEVLGQVKNDMEMVQARLMRIDVGRVTRAIESDLVETLKEMIQALEKAINENNNPNEPPPPGGPGPRRPPKLVDLLQQLKLIHAMQRRVNDRTQLYAKFYKGEQAPAPTSAREDLERRRLERIGKELKDLSSRQERIGRVTREIGKENPGDPNQGVPID